MKKKNRIISFIILGAAAAAAFCFFQIKYFASSILTISQETIFTLPAGTHRQGLSALLTEQKIAKDTRWLPWLLQLEPELANFKAGTYRFMPGMTNRQMLELLASGKEAQFSIRFIEGSSFADWQVILSDAPYLKHQLTGISEPQLAEKIGADKHKPIEGRLYPDTYLYTASTTDTALLKRAWQQMDKILQQTWQDRAEGLPYASADGLLTMASIIEKETGVPEERARVASVFINRLRIGMRLQTDPTVIYGMGKKYQGILTRQDLNTPTPYNTYQISGLPPGPIAMPGKGALNAAAHPDKTSYLYFVADGKGGHAFTTNLASHNQAVQQYRKIMKEKNAQ
ncbi:endolytic transglycosylase MltG [Biostraticola tofi]|uniref:Endolytic murein transglycosylase n=1 Tax=Biostraticola tofi TaxID=466109 RepID=A0A4R3Z2Y9_9GAMM|nr:endolytic transglycosylase MltG [Biostraticola tofi]TCV98254.1 UPF0755 protein [Biostraticola tofi]